MLVTLPFVLLLLDFWPLRRVETASRLVLEKIPLLALSAIVSVVTTLVVHSRVDAALDATSIWFRSGYALMTWVGYLAKTVWPARLAVFYPYPDSLSLAGVAVALAVLLSISSIALRLARHRPYVLFGWLWFLGMLVPVSGLVQAGPQAMADRYTYLPLVGIFVAVTWGAVDLVSDRRALALVTWIVLPFCAVASRLQLRHWSSSSALFEHALAVTEANDLAHVNLGHALMEQGDVRGAARHYLEAVRLRPKSVPARFDAGIALAAMGQIEPAVEHLSEVARLAPEDAETQYQTGAALDRLGHTAEALERYRAALRLRPADSRARLALEAAEHRAPLH